MTDSYDKDYDADNFFILQVRVTHPYLSLDIMTDILQVEPDFLWRKDDVFMAGDRERRRRESYWCKCFEIRGKRDFFAASISFMESHPLNIPMLKDFHSTGGNVMIVVQLFEGGNIGSVMDASFMKKALEWKYNIGVELFK